MNAGDWFAKGLELLDVGASQETLDALNTAIQLDPEFAEAYVYRGLAYYRLNNYAMQDYGKAVALWPNIAEAYYFRAILPRPTERIPGGHTRLHEPIDLKRALLEAYYFRALNHGAAGRYEEAVRDMKAAAELGYESAKRFLKSHKARPERN